MLAPTSWPGPRDLEIRDLYNMEDAFPLGRGLPRRLSGPPRRQPRLLGRSGRQDRLARWRGRRTSADRTGPGRLPGRRCHQTLRRARFVPGDRAGRLAGRASRHLRRPDAERRRHGHDLHPARQRQERARHPRRRQPGDQARIAGVPLLGSPQSRPPGRLPAMGSERTSRPTPRRAPLSSSTTSSPECFTSGRP